MGSCDYGDEPLGSGTMKLVIFLVSTGKSLCNTSVHMWVHFKMDIFPQRNIITMMCTITFGYLALV
jgi:hypothetical protein